MAQIVGDYLKKIADPSVVDSSLVHTLGTRGVDENGNEYVYMKGVASTVLGSWVTYDETYTTALLVANAIGPVAVAKGAIDSTSKYGWYCVWGTVSASLAASCADNASLGREGADGVVGDGRAAGDQIIGAISRGSTSSAANQTVQLFYPSVNDITGS